MLVQWPCGPQEAPELHSSTSGEPKVQKGTNVGTQGTDPLGAERSGGHGEKCLGLDMR